jgi:hypothetical protein
LAAGAAALILASGGPAAARAAEPVQGVAQEPSASAIALAKLVSGGEAGIEVEIALARTGLKGGLELAFEVKDIETEHLGLFDAVWTAVEPEVRRSIIADAPVFEDRLARLYSNSLTLTEIEGLKSFYSTPTGQKLIRSMYSGLDATPIIESAITGEGVISQEAHDAMVESATRKAASSVDPSAGDLAILERSISFEKMQRIGAEVRKLTLEWVNQEDPEFEAKLDELIGAAADKYFAKQGNGE